MSKRLQELEYFAQKFRDANSLSEKEPIRIKSILQKNNILTVYKPLSSGLSGMSIKIKSETKKGEIDDNSIRFILVNSKHSIGKQHFTICHELYHLYFQEKFSSSISFAGKFDKKGNPEEYDADLFAAYLLLPKWGIWELIPEDERVKNKISIAIGAFGLSNKTTFTPLESVASRLETLKSSKVGVYTRGFYICDREL